MKLSGLLAALPAYHLLPPLPTTPTHPDTIKINKLTADSRQVTPGALFVAYCGVSVDGHHFIPQAIERGAAAIIIEDENSLTSLSTALANPPPFIIVANGRAALAHLAAAWQEYPARRLTMVGITGTDGKTTTTNLLYHILKQAGHTVGLISTVNAIIGDAALETGLHTTTPDAPDVQRYLRQMADHGSDICLLETTSHGLAQHRVTACDFDVAMVTNITHEHLDIHGTLEAYWAAKAMLFESLAGAAAKGRPKLAILNCDDGSFEYLKERLARSGNVRWVGYSRTNHPEATITATDIACRPTETSFTLHTPAEISIEISTTLVGDYNVSNCLAAATAALLGLDVAPAVVQAGIAALPGIPGRMERIDEGQPFTAVVDFAHTPNSLRRTLTAARQLTQPHGGRVIAVFGCAGLRDVAKRTQMGQIAAELADITIITAEDPRTESLTEIMAATAVAMRSAGAEEGQTFEQIPDRGQAIFRAVQLARPGDMVLALGKGHEQSMCFGHTEHPWDDRQALRRALHGEPLLTLPTAFE